MLFEKTSFGTITISGKTYKSDMCLFVNGELQERDKSSSEKINGHRELAMIEIENLLKDNPEVLLIGMGQSGILLMSKETLSWLESIDKEKKVKIVRKKTPEIISITNKLIKSRKRIAGVFHITC